MKEFFKRELETLQAKTGIRQLETLMQKESWKEDINLLIDLMIHECNKPPFDLVRQDVKERVISRAIVEDSEFIGLNAKFVRKALNAWWQVYGDKILQARDQQEKHVPEKFELSEKEKEAIDVMANSYLQRLRSETLQPVEKLTIKQIREEGDVRPKAHVYHSTDRSYLNQVNEKVREGRKRYFLENYPGASDEQLQEYLNSFGD